MSTITETVTDVRIGMVGPITFGISVEAAMETWALADLMLSHGVDYSNHACYLSSDRLSGYAISPEGDLQSVFSLVRGRGTALIESANANGAQTLDCFDGYLPHFYGQHGWREVRREINWGGSTLPDVVYMERFVA